MIPESLLKKIQAEVTDILLNNNPDADIAIFSRTKGDTENDIENAMASLAQGLSVLPAMVKGTTPNIVSHLSLKKVSITVNTMSNIALGAKYDATQLAEWVAGLLHLSPLNSVKKTIYVDSISPFVLVDEEGSEIDGTEGASIELLLSDVALPRIKKKEI